MSIPALVVLIIGTRHPLSNKHKEIIYAELEYLNRERYGFKRIFLVHGDCSGVDKYAAEVATQMGWTPIPIAADWKQGKKAGPIRNQKMIDSSRPHVALAFPASDSTGTRDCIARIEEYRKSSISRLKCFKEILLE